MSYTTEEIRQELCSMRHFSGYSLKDIKRTSKRKITIEGIEESFVARTFKATNDSGTKILCVITDEDDDYIVTIMTEQEYTDLISNQSDVQVPDNFIPGYKKFENKLTGQDVLNFVIANCLANPSLISECEQAFFYYKQSKNWQLGEIDYKLPKVSDFIHEVDLNKVEVESTTPDDWHYYIDDFDELVNTNYTIDVNNTIAKFGIGMYRKCDTGVRFSVFLTIENELLLCHNNHD